MVVVSRLRVKEELRLRLRLLQNRVLGNIPGIYGLTFYIYVYSPYLPRILTSAMSDPSLTFSVAFNFL